ncbi:glycine zipper 2TM domain-containing protein [Bowmanella denitrificans]|uniref:Glycine zipper 2TM domain-containing protein n=1 Tax=Bowmanella denitrificans TaxID=366582 RepID=A0ABN0X6V0_9ALTE|nr:glycine zipper 2TM domain-containing protein [Bowmanella denitrificans]
MKAWFIPLSMLALSTNLQAAERYDYAKVKQVTPIYETILLSSEPEQVCYTTGRRHDATPTVVGAIIGGAVGHALGHSSSNKKVGMVAGAALGGAIGHDVGRNSYRQVCETRPGTQRRIRELTGYDVTYQYKGDLYHTVTQQHPGKRLKVKINVSPAFY